MKQTIYEATVCTHYFFSGAENLLRKNTSRCVKATSKLADYYFKGALRSLKRKVLTMPQIKVRKSEQEKYAREVKIISK